MSLLQNPYAASVAGDTQTGMQRARLCLWFALTLGLSPWLRAEDAAAKPRWSISAECQMVVLPQARALELIPQLMDEAKIDAAWQRLQQMITEGEATLVGNLVLKGEEANRLTSESVEELRYPTEFDPPQLPQEVPKGKAAEVLKNWPVVGITPTAFETRNVGQTLELYGSVSDDGQWIAGNVVANHVRLLRFDKFDAGLLPSGERLSVEQPQFLTFRNTQAMHLRTGQRALIGVHKLPGEKREMELTLLRISATRIGTKQ